MSDVLSVENHFGIENQKKCFEQGTKHVKLLRAAMPNKGIRVFGRDDKLDYINTFEENTDDLKLAKFVPASGAASRMFKQIVNWIDSPKKHSNKIKAFFQSAESLPFFDSWMQSCNASDIETYQAGLPSMILWLEQLVSEKGLDYLSKPKGVLPFHRYGEQMATPIREHIAETMALSPNKKPKLHFTVSPEHMALFEKEVSLAIQNLNLNTDAIDVEYSFQDSESDTIAMTTGGEVVAENGETLRRPGGHGALIQNLNTIDADIVFIKNIDNVTHQRSLAETVKYKKLLGGVLLDVKADLQRIYDQISKGLVDDVSIDSAREKWGLRIPRDYVKVTEYLKRPIRVCGMVKNEGEPGGGPFWTLDKYTGESLQIVEQSQIDKDNMRQEMILKSATHFNPVDIVCSTKGLDGKQIDLLNFVDEDLYFIVDKTHNGKPIKALEWPGLWNGAMAHWVTVFVEVPITTFNPVKEVGDLLRKAHL